MMTKAQIEKLQLLTGRLEAYFGSTRHKGANPIVFKAEVHTSGSVIFSATNSVGMRAFDTWYHIVACVGARGGVRNIDGTIPASFLF